jgi:hypothetical protein
MNSFLVFVPPWFPWTSIIPSKSRKQRLTRHEQVSPYKCLEKQIESVAKYCQHYSPIFFTPNPLNLNLFHPEPKKM